MAQKRMFDRAIIDTDRFMDLGMTAKALYFLLGMEADDEGFVSYKKVMRIHGGNEDDLKVLIAKKFVLHFQSGVIVITDWHSNNYLDSRRLRPTEYQDEKKMLILTDTNKYELSKGLASREERSIEEKRTIVYKIENENPKKEKTTLEGFEEFWGIYPKKQNKVGASAEWRKLNSEDRDAALKAVSKRVWKDPQYIPMPSNFLKDRRWEDDITKITTYRV